MLTFYIQDLTDLESGPLHSKAFTTKRLAISYLCNAMDVWEGKYGYFYDSQGVKVAAIKTLKLSVD